MGKAIGNVRGGVLWDRLAIRTWVKCRRVGLRQWEATVWTDFPVSPHLSNGTSILTHSTVNWSWNVPLSFFLHSSWFLVCTSTPADSLKGGTSNLIIAKLSFTLWNRHSNRFIQRLYHDKHILNVDLVRQRSTTRSLESLNAVISMWLKA